MRIVLYKKCTAKLWQFLHFIAKFRILVINFVCVRITSLHRSTGCGLSYYIFENGHSGRLQSKFNLLKFFFIYIYKDQRFNGEK